MEHKIDKLQEDISDIKISQAIQTKMLENHEQILTKQEKILENHEKILSKQEMNLEKQEQILEVNTASLLEHMRRTEILEKRATIIENQMIVLNTERATTFKALKIAGSILAFLGAGTLIAVIRFLIGI